MSHQVLWADLRGEEFDHEVQVLRVAQVEDEGSNLVVVTLATLVYLEDLLFDPQGQLNKPVTADLHLALDLFEFVFGGQDVDQLAPRAVSKLESRSLDGVELPLFELQGFWLVDF